MVLKSKDGTKIRQIDPKAFIVITKIYDVSGGYEKRLI